MATGQRNNARGFHTGEPIVDLARPPEPGEYFAELIKHEFLADEAEQALRAVLPGGEVLSSRQEVLAKTAEGQAKIEKVFNALKERTRKAEMAVGSSRIKLFALQEQFTRDYPRLEIKVSLRYVPEEDKVKYRITVAHKTQHVYLIDEEEDENVFPSEWLLARLGLVG